jgi:hypothetical protein
MVNARNNYNGLGGALSGAAGLTSSVAQGNRWQRDWPNLETSKIIPCPSHIFPGDVYTRAAQLFLLQFSLFLISWTMPLLYT